MVFSPYAYVRIGLVDATCRVHQLMEKKNTTMELYNMHVEQFLQPSRVLETEIASIRVCSGKTLM